MIAFFEITYLPQVIGSGLLKIVTRCIVKTADCYQMHSETSRLLPDA